MLYYPEWHDGPTKNWPAPNSYGFIAQLVEHCTGIAEVTGSNPAEAWIFFRLLFRNCLNCVSTAKIFHNVITYNRGTNPVTIMLYYPEWHDGPTKNWPAPNSYGFIAQLVEHCTGIAEVTGSNPAEAWIFFRLLFRNCLNCVSAAKIFHNVITYNRGTNPVTIMLYYPEWHDGPTKNWPAPNSYGFIAQLVEHCTGIAEVTGSNPAEAWIFFRLLFRNCLNCVSTAKIFHNVITYNRGTNPVTIMLYYPEWHDGPTKNWPAPNSYGFIAQLVEHCTGIAEVTGSNPAEAWIFFRLLFRNCLNCVSAAKIFHNVITYNRGTNPVTIMLYYP